MPQCTYHAVARPLVELAAEILLQTARPQGKSLDLQGLVALAPTRQSARRLRERLAIEAEARGGAVLGSCIQTPSALVQSLIPPARLASEMDIAAAWLEAARTAELERVVELLPELESLQDESWCLGLGKTLQAIRLSLSEAARDVREVADKRLLPEEGARWEAFAYLEDAYREALQKCNLLDPIDARLQAIREGRPPASLQRILLLGVCDPVPYLLKLLERLEGEGLAVEVHVFGEEPERFDGWGRPLASWKDVPVSVRNTQIHLEESPREQARTLARFVEERGGASGLAVGLEQHESAVLLQAELKQRNLPCWRPEEHSFKQSAWYAAIEGLLTLEADDRYRSFQPWIRQPMVAKALAKAASIPARELWKLADRLASWHLPRNLRNAIEIAGKQEPFQPLKRALEHTANWLKPLREGSISQAVGAWLTEIGPYGLSGDPALATRLIEEADLLKQALEALHRHEQVSPELSRSLRTRLFLEQLADIQLPEPREPEGLTIQNWLELAWDPAPRLLIGDFNEGLIPGPITLDGFIPDSQRAALGLRDSASRFAVDRYLLELMLSSRDAGKVDFLLPRVSLEGEPLRPSRLLLNTREEELCERVDYLFQELPVEEQAPPFQLAWKLQPEATQPPEKVSVTALRDYLNCPYRFYLRHILDLRTDDPRAEEMDAGGFGDLLHGVLDAFGSDPQARQSSRAEEIFDCLQAELSKQAVLRFGPSPPLPVVFQLDSLEQRLRAVAEVQAEIRAEGWLIEHVESYLQSFHPLGWHGIAISGKIDRIDRHEESGAIRIIDYKTKDKFESCEAAHLSRYHGRPAVPEYAICESEGKWRWRDLQLPLYLEAIRLSEIGSSTEDIQLAHLLIPRAVSETALSPWVGLSHELQQSAMTCAEGILGEVAAGHFWPPARRVDFDDFEAFFPSLPEDCVLPPKKEAAP